VRGSSLSLGRQADEASNGSIVERPHSVWWVRLRSLGGRMGWTRDTDKFDNKDALGAAQGSLIEAGQVCADNIAIRMWRHEVAFG
jgi:hypothetical protein